MKKSFLLFACGIFSALPLAHAGDLTGTITLKGTPPAESDLGSYIQSDPNCAALYSGAFPTTHFFNVSAGGGLADVVVVLKGDFKSTNVSAAPVVLDQKNCLYSPTILAVQAGQKLLVKNSDPCVHNVHTVPKENEMKNLVQAPGTADLEFVFDKPEPFLKMQCDVHAWMFAYVTVLDSPYFAVSGKDGKFTIKNVPPGKYTVTAMHRKISAVLEADGKKVAGYKGVEKAIEVTAAGATADFVLELK